MFDVIFIEQFQGLAYASMHAILEKLIVYEVNKDLICKWDNSVETYQNKI